MTAITAADYGWADDWVDSVGQGYCLTLARGLAPAEFLARIGAVPEATRHGLEALRDPTWELWETDPVERMKTPATNAGSRRSLARSDTTRPAHAAMVPAVVPGT
jgi:hypothetical protein